MGLLLKRDMCHSLIQTSHSFNVFIQDPERDKTMLTGLLASFCLTVPRTNVGYLHVWMSPDKRVPSFNATAWLRVIRCSRVILSAHGPCRKSVGYCMCRCCPMNGFHHSITLQSVANVCSRRPRSTNKTPSQALAEPRGHEAPGHKTPQPPN